MTKAKARQRAKTKAAQKIKKRLTNADQEAQKFKPGKFDPSTFSIKGPNSSAGAGNFSTAKRGSARSK
jgi:hypothetical protein